MQIQVEFWQLVTLVITMVGAYAGIAKLLMAQYTKSIDQKFGDMTKLIELLGQQGERYGADVLRLERELSAFRLEAERAFTRREDHNQAIARISVGLDHMSLRIEKALAKGGRFDV